MKKSEKVENHWKGENISTFGGDQLIFMTEVSIDKYSDDSFQQDFMKN